MSNYAKGLCTYILQTLYVQNLQIIRRLMYTPSTDMTDEPHLPPKLLRVELRIAASDLRAWRATAVREKQKLSEWIRRACDEHMAKETKKR